MDLQRLRTGCFEMRPRVNRLRATIVRTVDILLPMARVPVALWVHPGTPEHAFFDPLRLQQCVNNALSNACKYATNEGADIKVAVWTLGSLAAGIQPQQAALLTGSSSGPRYDSSDFAQRADSAVASGVAAVAGADADAPAGAEALHTLGLPDLALIPPHAWYKRALPDVAGMLRSVLPAGAEAPELTPAAARSSAGCARGLTAIDCLQLFSTLQRAGTNGLAANPAAAHSDAESPFPPSLFAEDGFSLEWLVIDVSDSGAGLGGRTGQALFEPFVQGAEAVSAHEDPTRNSRMRGETRAAAAPAPQASTAVPLSPNLLRKSLGTLSHRRQRSPPRSFISTASDSTGGAKHRDAGASDSVDSRSPAPSPTLTAAAEPGGVTLASVASRSPFGAPVLDMSPRRGGRGSAAKVAPTPTNATSTAPCLASPCSSEAFSRAPSVLSLPPSAARDDTSSRAAAFLVSGAHTLVHTPAGYRTPGADRAWPGDGSRAVATPATSLASRRGRGRAAAGAASPSAGASAARKGTGLGLALTASLVERMGGHVALTEAAGRTHFIILISCPMKQALPEDATPVSLVEIAATTASSFAAGIAAADLARHNPFGRPDREGVRPLEPATLPSPASFTTPHGSLIAAAVASGRLLAPTAGSSGAPLTPSHRVAAPGPTGLTVEPAPTDVRGSTGVNVGALAGATSSPLSSSLAVSASPTSSAGTPLAHRTRFWGSPSLSLSPGLALASSHSAVGRTLLKPALAERSLSMAASSPCPSPTSDELGCRDESSLAHCRSGLGADDAMGAMLAAAGIRHRPVADSRSPVGPAAHFLVCEDDLTNRRLVQRMLERIGCSCTLLEDGDMAAAALEASGQLLVSAAPSTALAAAVSTGMTSHMGASSYAVAPGDLLRPVEKQADASCSARAASTGVHVHRPYDAILMVSFRCA